MATMFKGALMVKLPSMMDARTKRIRELMERWIENTFELGKELADAKREFAAAANDKDDTEGVFRRIKRGGKSTWEQWLNKDLGISISHADKLIRIHDKFGKLAIKPKLSVNVLDYLAHRQIPPAGRTEVMIKAARGEPMTKRRAKEIMAQHLPKPKEAAKIARETGKLVLASDHKYYTGATDDEAKVADKRREIVYGVHRAIDTLAGMELTPHEFLEYAMPHQLWKKSEEHKIKEALGWLQALHTTWERRRK